MTNYSEMLNDPWSKPQPVQWDQPIADAIKNRDLGHLKAIKNDAEYFFHHYRGREQVAASLAVARCDAGMRFLRSTTAVGRLMSRL
jgi:hypothetical protein